MAVTEHLCKWQILDTRSEDEKSWLSVTPEIADGPRSVALVPCLLLPVSCSLSPLLTLLLVALAHVVVCRLPSSSPSLIVSPPLVMCLACFANL